MEKRLGSLSIMHWFVVLIIFAVYGVPVVKILRRAGYSGWWVIVTLIPIVNIIALWIFAFSSWPALGGLRPSE
jgi:hypothetical protein